MGSSQPSQGMIVVIMRMCSYEGSFKDKRGCVSALSQLGLTLPQQIQKMVNFGIQLCLVLILSSCLFIEVVLLSSELDN